MKIGLITVHNVTNYGAILQAYATMVMLRKYGEVKTIDYQNPMLKHHLHVVRFQLSIRGFKMAAHDVLNFSSRSKLISKFKNFINSNLNLTQPFTAKDIQKGKMEDFNILVCGSDQIWNPKIISKSQTLDPIYFLNFAKGETVKIAFASSMGNYEYSQEQADKIKAWLSDFRRISVREFEGVDFLKKLSLPPPVFKVLDPTLGLNKAEWLSLFNIDSSSSSEDYILVYSVPRTTLIRKAILYYKEKLGLKVVAIDKMFIPMEGVDEQVRNAGIKEFLELYAHSSFVITDSFHGTCFSVNFEKPFVCIPADKRANRQEGLLRSLDLQGRIIYNEETFSDLEPELNFDEPRIKLAALRQETLDFLSDAIVGES